jgi:hypothetical protein
MLLLASAPTHALHRNDLGCSGKLQFKVHARELGKEQLQLLDVDLSLFVGHNTKAAGPLSNGHQTMVIVGVYTVGVLRSSGSGFQAWGTACRKVCTAVSPAAFPASPQDNLYLLVIACAWLLLSTTFVTPNK